MSTTTTNDTRSVSIPEAYEEAKEAGYYPVPYWPTGDPARPLMFPPGATGGAHELQYVPIDPRAKFMGFRLPHDIIALDVDHHDAKRGMEYLGKYQADNGLPQLPPTYRITSRGNDDAGKMLYRVSGDIGTNYHVRKNVCPDVEIITSRHMFVGGVPGTVHHKTEWVNECYGPNGALCELPEVSDVPCLPVEWEVAIETEPADLADTDASIPADDGEDCPHARAWWGGYTELTREGWKVKGGADFGGGQVRGIREFNALVYLKTMAIHGHHVGRVIAEARDASPELATTIAERWDAARGHAADNADCCKVAQPPATSSPVAQPTTTATNGPESNTKPVGRLKLVQAGSRGIKRTEWLWEPYVPAHTLTMLGGMEKSGKSQIAIELAARVTRAGHGVLILATEDEVESVTDPRLIAAGANLSLISHVEVSQGEDDIVLRTDLDALGELAAGVNASLVIIDPIISVLDGATDGDSYKDISKELGRLVTWAKERRVTVLALTHLRKTSDGVALNKMMGSRAFTSKPRSVLLTAVHPEDTEVRLLAHAACNVGKEGPTIGYAIESALISLDTMTTAIPQGGQTVETSKVRYLDNYEMLTADSLMAAAKPVGRPPKSLQCADWVRDYLAERGGVAAVAEVRAAAMAEGFGRKLLEMPEMKVLGRFTAQQTSGIVPAVHYWALLDEAGEPAVPTGTQVKAWQDAK